MNVVFFSIQRTFSIKKMGTPKALFLVNFPVSYALESQTSSEKSEENAV